MSMTVGFKTATDREIAALLERPQRILRFFELPEPEPKVGLLARLFGGKSPAAQADDWHLDPDNEEFDADKAWHGIHFLLTGTAWKGEPPLHFMVRGGTEIGKIDIGYGPARGFTSKEVAAICDALEPITAETLKERCDRAAFHQHEIYPNIWDEPDDECFGYVLSYFGGLKAFVQRTRGAGKGFVVSLV